MEETPLGNSEPTPSGNLVGFPRYRRSHLRGETYRTLVCILSHCYGKSQLSHISQIRNVTENLNNKDNGDDGMGQASLENESESVKFVIPEITDCKDNVHEKETHYENLEVVGLQGEECSDTKMAINEIELMMEVENDEDSSRRQEMMICEDKEATSKQAKVASKEQQLIDELEQIVQGTEKLGCENGLTTALSLGLNEKQNSSSEVELMDNLVEHVEFQQSDMNKSRTASEPRLEGLNQDAPPSFGSYSLAEVSKSSMQEQSSLSGLGKSSTRQEIQPNEMEFTKPICSSVGSLPAIEEVQFEKEEQSCLKVVEEMQVSLDQDMIDEVLNLSNFDGDKSLLDTGGLEAKQGMQHDEEQLEKLFCVNDGANSSSHVIEEGDIEEGEISDDYGTNGNLFDMPSADSLMLQQKKVGNVQKHKNLIENLVYPSNIPYGEKQEDQPVRSSKLVELREIDEVATSKETIKSEDAGKYYSMQETGKSNCKDIRCKEVTGDHANSSKVELKAGVNSKKKRGPVSEEKKAKKKEKKRKKRAEMNRKLGVKRLKLPLIVKPKAIVYCRHFLKGRCHEGDKCKFSHDTVPLTKSKPCCHFARQTCMKGDDCPFDHQLSKYPCSNFASRGSCSRGDACMFSHQMPTKEDIPTSPNDCRADTKSPMLPVNTNFSKPLKISGTSASQQNQFSGSSGIHSYISGKQEEASTEQKSFKMAPKGVSFINVGKSPLLNPGALKQGTVTPNRGGAAQIGTATDQSASVTSQNLEVSKKKPVVAPRGINFLSFGKGCVTGSKISDSSCLNRENIVKFPRLGNFDLLEQLNLSLKNDDSSKVGIGTKQQVQQTVLCSNDILKDTQSEAKAMDPNIPRKASIDVSTTDNSQGQSLTRCVQESVKASNNSQTSIVSLSMPPVSPLALGQSSERLTSGHCKNASKSAHKVLMSTLAFAAEHESGIKMKSSTGSPAVKSENRKEIL
ncbi:hypothetical protein L6164_013944 [Bauhinia variegata]|uniref:Uncharacterized protein n=1 Tax=Bauhinia variegata TaxID=167791 RepID=A0ACB9NH74_BAUVA|nr:hypothetical protein L6164_013944 [Bauhinia variegata]